MSDKRVMFLKVLKAELEDLRQDIGLVEQKAAQRLAQAEITDYVYKENEALWRLMVDSLDNLVAVIDGSKPDQYKNTDDLVEDVDRRVKDLVREHEDPEAVYKFFLRKLAKVRKYVDGGE